jgi:RHS repeat-associated protein
MQPDIRSRVASPHFTTLLITTYFLMGVLLCVPNAKAADQEKTYYFLYDHLGSVDVVLDDEGNVVERADYEPYGEDRLRVDGDGTPIGAPIGNLSASDEHKYTGQELDSETGLYYYGARYYNPSVGRFISEDPWEGDLSNPQTLNKYSYVLNNPLKYVDPTGLYNMKTGEVEKGDTLGGITGELNNYFGTKYSYNDIAQINNIANPDAIKIGQKVLMGTINEDGSTWSRAYDAKEVTIGYWNSLTESQKNVTHYGRNLFQGDLPKDVRELNGSEWSSKGAAIAHNLAGASGNMDYRGIGARDGQQAIYDSNGSLITSPENMGTYDFGDIKLSNIGVIDHVEMDLLPWIQWGNTPRDTTSASERNNAFQSIFNF